MKADSIRPTASHARAMKTLALWGMAVLCGACGGEQQPRISGAPRPGDAGSRP